MKTHNIVMQWGLVGLMGILSACQNMPEKRAQLTGNRPVKSVCLEYVDRNAKPNPGTDGIMIYDIDGNDIADEVFVIKGREGACSFDYRAIGIGGWSYNSFEHYVSPGVKKTLVIGNEKEMTQEQQRIYSEILNLNR